MLKDKIVEHLSSHPAQTVEKLQLATLTKSTTLHRALTELLSEGRIRRRRHRRRDFYFIREDHTT